MDKKISFPHIGDLSIVLASFFREIGIDTITPPENSQKTLDLGVKYAPEFACLPLKITLGNFIEALENGADCLLMAGGCGPCRLGYYAEVQKEILKDLGYDFEMLILEPDIKNLYVELKKMFAGVSKKKLIKAGHLTWKKLKAIDNVNKLLIANRACEKEPGQLDKLYKKFLLQLEKTSSHKNIDLLKEDFTQAVNDVKEKFNSRQQIKIGLVGEIYMVIDQFANMDIEKKLGNMGARVYKDIYISEWFAHFLHLNNEIRHVKKAARPYLKNFVGGHGIETVGNTVRYSNKDFDGVIQLGPFTCMPELVAKTVLNKVSSREEIPVLSFFMDEHRGEAGFKTRLEAFVDLLSRKKTKEKEYGSVF